LSEGAYEYRGLLASTWDLLRGDTSKWEDRFFFHDCIERYGQPVLDVGCGTGRLLLDFMAEGIDIDGFDNSPEMLALCQAKAETLDLQPALFEGWMESMRLPRRYRTIIVPSSTFQLITDPALARRAMERFQAHLEPGGVLIMSFFIVGDEDYESPDWKLLGEAVRPDDNAIVRKYSRIRYELATQLQHTRDRYEIWLDGQLTASEHHSQSPAVRSYTQEQALDLYEHAGYINVAIRREFSDEPAGADDGVFTVTGFKP
jgi:ubiquinone/menaquinone biosynthesis C-methylase UbiE